MLREDEGEPVYLSNPFGHYEDVAVVQIHQALLADNGRDWQIDEELLREISESTDGRYYRATSPEQLQKIFATIDTLERTEIESKVRVLYSELFYWLLIPALLLLLAERAITATRARRIP